MSKERDIDQWIDDYIFGRLDKDSSQQFLERLQSDQDLATQVKLRKEMKEGIEAFGRKDLKETLKDIHQEVTEIPKVQSKNNKIVYYAIFVTLIVALLAALVWGWMFGSSIKKENPEQLYLAYFEPYQLSDLQRSESNQGVFQLQQLYKNQKYIEVLPLFHQHLDTLTN